MDGNGGNGQVPFKKGQSGNPSGINGWKRKSPNARAEIRKLAEAACPKAIRALTAQLDDHDPRIVANAATLLLDRGIGRPAQQLDVLASTHHTHEHTVALSDETRAWWEEAKRQLGIEERPMLELEADTDDGSE